MKKIRIIMILFLFVLMVPFVVRAEDEEMVTTSANVPVNVYFFHGDGCPHCAEAKEWFESIKEEYGSYFNVVSYEVWYDADNKELMDGVADYLNETVTGVPFIIVGDKNFKGFNEEIGQEILDEIKSEYELDYFSRFDVIDSYNAYKEENKTKNSENLTTSLISVVVIAAVVVFIVFSRRGIKEEEKKSIKENLPENNETLVIKEKKVKEEDKKEKKYSNDYKNVSQKKNYNKVNNNIKNKDTQKTKTNKIEVNNKKNK